MLSDILPTGFECGVLNGQVKPGDTVAIVGAGPIGLAALLTAQFYSPAAILMIDLDDNRLQVAKQFGATTLINSTDGTAVERVMALTEGAGVDVAIEAVGIPATFDICQNLPITLIRERVERVPLTVFDALQPNDVLLIDSSHVAKFGGDVTRELLDILPRLQPGVWIHVHDIFFPHDYPADFLMTVRHAWNERYFLEAFLKFNRAFAPASAAHWLWSDYHRNNSARPGPRSSSTQSARRGPPVSG